MGFVLCLAIQHIWPALEQAGESMLSSSCHSSTSQLLPMSWGSWGPDVSVWRTLEGCSQHILYQRAGLSCCLSSTPTIPMRRGITKADPHIERSAHAKSNLCVVQERLALTSSVSSVPFHGQRNEKCLSCARRVS